MFCKWCDTSTYRRTDGTPVVITRRNIYVNLLQGFFLDLWCWGVRISLMTIGRVPIVVASVRQTDRTVSDESYPLGRVLYQTRPFEMTREKKRTLPVLRRRIRTGSRPGRGFTRFLRRRRDDLREPLGGQRDSSLDRRGRQWAMSQLKN